MNSTRLHFDDAWSRAVSGLSKLLQPKPGDWRVVLIVDVTGRVRIILWCPTTDWTSGQDEIDGVLAQACGPYWSKGIIKGEVGERNPDVSWQQRAWDQGTVVDGTHDRLRTLTRHRAKAAWFHAPTEPPWPGGRGECTIGLFYSFKGGVGRSTALAATALRLAADGERVVVLDADFDAPGVGSLLSGREGIVASHGIVDYLIEQPVLAHAELNPRLDEYYHSCFFPHSGSDKEILVFPSGSVDAEFIEKLGRLDYTSPLNGDDHVLVALMRQIRDALEPNWILIDSRAGLGEASGFLTGGFCHVNVLFGALAEASWRGTELILDRLGRRRLRGPTPRSQAECIWVAAMVPRQQQQYRAVTATFRDRSRDLFEETYYADSMSGEDFWTVADLDEDDSPHVPVVIPYEPLLADFTELTEVADTVLLKDRHYEQLVERLRTCRARM